MEEIIDREGCPPDGDEHKIDGQRIEKNLKDERSQFMQREADAVPTGNQHKQIDARHGKRLQSDDTQNCAQGTRFDDMKFNTHPQKVEMKEYHG